MSSSHDPDGCRCGIWPIDQTTPPPRDPAEMAGRGPDDLWRPAYSGGGVLHGRRLCRHCGQPVRLAVSNGLPLHVEPHPLPPATVRRDWPALWWSDRWGFTDREPCSDRDELLFVLHPCDIRTHQPSAPQPAQGEPRMTAPTFGTARPPGEGASNADLEGKLLLISVTEKKIGFVTTSGVTDLIVADVVDLSGGEEHPGNFLFGKVLFGQFEVGVTYLGTIGKGIAKPGQSAPWLFTGSENDPAAVQQAQQYLAYKAQQTPAPAAAAPAPPAASPFAGAPAAAAAAPWATA